MLFHAVHLDAKDLFLWKIQTILLDVLPKLLLGKTWIWTSFKAFRQLENKIVDSRERLKISGVKTRVHSHARFPSLLFLGPPAAANG